MRVLMLTGSFLPHIGGAEVGVHNLSEGLVEIGQQVLLCAELSGQKPEHLHSYELRRYSIPRGTFRLAIADWWVRSFLSKVAAEWKPEVIHAHFTWPTGYAAAQAGKDLHIPVLITPRGGDLQVREDIQYGYRLRPALRKKIDAAVRDVDGLVALSQNMQAELIRLGAQAGRITEIPNGTNYRLLADPYPEARAELGLPRDKFIILAVGRNVPVKGFASLIRATALLAQQNLQVLCLIVGRNLQTLRPLIDECSVVESVRLYDEAFPVGIEFIDRPTLPEERVLTFYQAADVYAMPSLMEGLPGSGIEAMSAGLPLVATRTPGALALVHDGINGILTPIEAPEELASALYKLMSNPDLRRSMGNEARRLAQRFDRQNIAAQHLALYQRLTQITNY